MTIGRFWGPTLDCPDPRALAEFYRIVGGGTIAVSTEEFVELRLGAVSLGLQRDPAYSPPTWPSGDVPQQCHLDFSAADLDQAQAAALAAGGGFSDVMRCEETQPSASTHN